ncbi:hypothetical protein GOV03_01425 [Candidatus Woesearchaeota archaeon]|nr:hypothetical protein [Candidatus Woesearchaeota archaeon]
MFQKISQAIKETLNTFSAEDQILFNNKTISIDKTNFQPLSQKENKTIAFVDGGQAEIISTGNFCLSFIRIFAQTFQNNKKISSHKNEFYLFTKAKWVNDDLHYESQMFPLNEKLINEEDLFISSNHPTIKNGTERASISKVSNMARRFAELSLASKLQVDFIILDGTLTPTFQNEDQFLQKLPKNTSAIAKSSQLFTVSGNSPSVLLNKLGPIGCWSYQLNAQTHFIKLHQQAKHVFRFEGSTEVLPYLIPNSQDPLFLGYPYGLIFADQFARITNQEKSSLKTKFLLQIPEIKDYLSTTNAHDILDSIS